MRRQRSGPCKNPEQWSSGSKMHGCRSGPHKMHEHRTRPGKMPRHRRSRATVGAIRPSRNLMAGLFFRETRLELEGNGAASCKALATFKSISLCKILTGL
jgi:hypothetical protein